MKTLNTNSLEGTLVIITDATADNGTEEERARTFAHLQKYTRYTVQKMNISKVANEVYLNEFPDKTFNPVMFETLDAD